MDKIVLAAGQLFAHHGYHGTSTREIARLADVSENTLFRHFNNKEDLFWSSLRAYTSGLKLPRDVLDGLTQCGSPEVVLPRVFELLTDMVKFKPDLLRLLAVSFLELNWNADNFCDEHLAPFLSVIHRYLATNIKSGKLRDLDPTIITAALTATTLIHPWVSQLIDGGKLPYGDGRDAGRMYSRFWLDVLSPRMPAYQPQITSCAVEDLG